MINEDLISIIIPILNRANLIGETIESILSQTYKEWECIIVDDGSTDSSREVIEEYTKVDDRVKLYRRPLSHLRGANSCRNYGFRKSSGSYIIWFDSDDLMTRNHLEKKIKAVKHLEYDFVVAQTANFRHKELFRPYKYAKKTYGIRASDFILLKIHWYTYDVLLKRIVAEQIQWNEKMKSWQDYNYFCKMLIKTEKGVYLDEVLTHRRIHPYSIQANLKRTNKNFITESLDNRVLTYKDIAKDLDQRTENELLFGMMNLSFELVKISIFSSKILWVIKLVGHKKGKSSAFFFILSLTTSFVLKRGYYLLERSKAKGKDQ